MSFIFNCPDCGNQLQAEDEWDGIRSQCPFCGRDIVIRRTQETAPDIKYGRCDDGKENGQKSGFFRFFPLENVSVGLILKLSALIAVIGLIIFFIITGSLRTAFWIFVLLIIILRVRFSRMIPAKYIIVLIRP